MSEQSAIERFIDRVERLIREDDDLTVVETVGALHMIAGKIMMGAFNDADEPRPE